MKKTRREKATQALGGEHGAEEAPGRPNAQAQGPGDRLGRKTLGPAWARGEGTVRAVLLRESRVPAAREFIEIGASLTREYDPTLP